MSIASANPAMAAEIVRNAKLRRVTVCGATETLLIDRDVAPAMLPLIAHALDGCELRGDAQARAIVPMAEATEADWRTEYLAPMVAVRTVENIEEAIAHIRHFGTGHTEAIIAEDCEAAEHLPRPRRQRDRAVERVDPVRRRRRVRLRRRNRHCDGQAPRARSGRSRTTDHVQISGARIWAGTAITGSHPPRRRGGGSAKR